MSIQVSGVYGGGSKINGVKNEYLATANISKGDFVQLTTKGVEEVAFTEVAHIDLENTTREAYAGCVCVMSSTRVIYAYVDGKGSESNPCTIYAQALNYVNGEWVEGTKLAVSTNRADSSTDGRVLVEAARLSDNEAVIFYGTDYLESFIAVVEVSEIGEITVVDKVTAVSGAWKMATSVKVSDSIIVLNNTSFVILLVDFSNNALRVIPCEYKDRDLTVYNSVLGGATSLSGVIGACKVNQNLILLLYTSSSSTSTFYFVLVSVYGSSVTVTRTRAGDLIGEGVIAKPGRLIYIEDNRILCLPIRSAVGSSQFTSPVFLSYNNDGTWLSEKVEIQLPSGPTHAVRISDDKIFTLGNKGGSTNDVASSASYTSGIIDLNELTFSTLGEQISSLGNVNNGSASARRLDAYDGVMAVMSGKTSVLVAPCVSQTTAEPFNYRIDGVASKGATAGQMAEVVTP